TLGGRPPLAWRPCVVRRTAAPRWRLGGNRGWVAAPGVAVLRGSADGGSAVAAGHGGHGWVGAGPWRGRHARFGGRRLRGGGGWSRRRWGGGRSAVPAGQPAG